MKPLSSMAGPPVARSDRLATWAAVLLATAALAWLQQSFAGLYDLDSYFHARAAIELDEQGVRTTFPQAAFSIWSDRYSDKDFLFHRLAAPWISEEDLVAGGKRAVVFMDLLFFASVAFALVQLRIRFGAVWLLLLLATSVYYVARLIPLRPQTLGLALLTVEIALLARDRWKSLFVVGIVHVLAHSSFPLAFALLALRMAAAFVTGTPLPLRSAIALVAGVGVGLVVHPYFPNNLEIARAQIFELAGQLWSDSGTIPAAAFGSELRPMGLQTFFLATPGWLPALVALLVALWAGGRRDWSTRDVFLGFTTLAFLALAFASRRFLDILIVSAVLFAGALWTTLAQNGSLRAWLERRPAVAGSCLATVLACLLGGAFAAWSELPGYFGRQTYADIFAPAIAQLDGLAAEDDVVYHPTWREFSYLYGFRPEGRYISGLDPIFLHRKSPSLFEKRWALLRGRARDPYAVLTGDFGARWVFVTNEPRFHAFRRLLRRSPRIKRVWSDGMAEIWSVAPARAATARPAERRR